MPQRKRKIVCVVLALLVLGQSTTAISTNSLVAMIVVDGTPQYAAAKSDADDQQLQIQASSFCKTHLVDGTSSTIQSCTTSVFTLLRSQRLAQVPVSFPWRQSSTSIVSIVSTLTSSSNIIVVDNFLEDPFGLRNFALSQPFNQSTQKKKETKSTTLLNPRQLFRRTKAFNSDPAFTPLRDAVEQVLDQKTINWMLQPSQNVNFQLVFDLPGEHASHCVHVDGSEWGGIVYLSPTPPTDRSTGTSFFRHKRTNTVSANDPNSQGWEQDKYDPSKWELVYKVENVFNRLVLFDAQMYHRSSGYFGDDESIQSQGRLFMNFFFNFDQRTTMKKEKKEQVSIAEQPVVKRKSLVKEISPSSISSSSISSSSTSSSTSSSSTSSTSSSSSSVDRSSSLLNLSQDELDVAQQYERLPYPYEGHRTLNSVIGCTLNELNHFLWGGGRDFRKTGLYILVAGGGTSGASAVLAKSLLDNSIPGLVVHLDLSLTSVRNFNLL